MAAPCGTLFPTTSPPRAPSPRLWGVWEGTPAYLSQRRGKKSSCVIQYHVILGKQRSLGAGNGPAVPRMGFPPAGTLLPAAHSWENHRDPQQ